MPPTPHDMFKNSIEWAVSVGPFFTFHTGSGLEYYPKNQAELDMAVYASNPKRVRGQGVPLSLRTVCATK